jgi:hypothetical protein
MRKRRRCCEDVRTFSSSRQSNVSAACERIAVDVMNITKGV